MNRERKDIQIATYNKYNENPVELPYDLACEMLSEYMDLWKYTYYTFIVTDGPVFSDSILEVIGGAELSSSRKLLDLISAFISSEKLNGFAEEILREGSRDLMSWFEEDNIDVFEDADEIYDFIINKLAEIRKFIIKPIFKIV